MSEANEMAQKIKEAQLNNQWPETIEVIWAGIQTTMNKIGIGAYPYECAAKDKHPDSVIYQGDAGWCPSHDLIEIQPGIYQMHYQIQS